MIASFRVWFISTTFLAAFVIAACGVKSKQPTAEETLNVYNWANFIAPDTVANFERETGIKVQYNIFETDATLEAKLLAGHTNYDIVFPSDTYFGRLTRAHALRKLDKGALSNSGNLDSDIMRDLAVHDPGNQYGVPYLWSSTGIGYNVDKVHERLGSIALNSWSVLFDPKNAAKLKDCGIQILDAPSDVLPAVLMYLGKNPYSSDPVDLDAAAATLMKIRPFVRLIESVGAIDGLASGSLCLVLDYSGVVTQAKYDAQEASNGVRIRFLVPREGALVGSNVMAIPADAPHPQNAEKWLNYLMRSDVIANVTNAVKFPNAIRASLPFVQDAIKNDRDIYPDEETRAGLRPDLVMQPEQARLMTRLWTRFRTGE